MTDRSDLFVKSTQLSALPDEVILTILTHCDIPDLLALSRTCDALRRLALDSTFHRLRMFTQIPVQLSQYLLIRPSETELLARHILRSPSRLGARYHAIASTLRLAFARNSLGRKLACRPNVDELIARGIYPPTDARVSPVIAMRCKALERENVRNKLEMELKTRVWDRITATVKTACDDKQQSVRVLVARFTSLRDCGNDCRIRDTPTRAKVYRMRMLFERMTRSAVAVV
ncbi:hypothetical protein V1512DRAFT_256900 [Lipomyces arxii]|uniref:uncharacterized protein n=1 Tax=Lipomyces arxii TaxID=56418 RepID=UPI0034CE7271